MCALVPGGGAAQITGQVLSQDKLCHLTQQQWPFSVLWHDKQQLGDRQASSTWLHSLAFHMSPTCRWRPRGSTEAVSEGLSGRHTAQRDLNPRKKIVL